MKSLTEKQSLWLKTPGYPEWQAIDSSISDLWDEYCPDENIDDVDASTWAAFEAGEALCLAEGYFVKLHMDC